MGERECARVVCGLTLRARAARITRHCDNVGPKHDRERKYTYNLFCCMGNGVLRARFDRIAREIAGGAP